MRFCDAYEKFKVTFFNCNSDSRCDPFDNFTFNCDSLFSNEIDEVLEDVNFLKKFFIGKEISSEEEIPDNIFNIMLKYLKKERCKGLSFYTICPKERLPFNDSEVMRLENFAEDFFKNEKIFESAKWCVESGKYKDRPNLHIHALCSFKEKGGKNFSRLLKKKWIRVYPSEEHTIDYNIKGNKGIHRVPCNTLRIQRDKEIYMNNGSKGSHENFCDLNISGEFKSVDSSTSQ